MAVKMIIDSTTDLAPSIEGKCIVVPLTLSFGEEEFIDGVTITHEQFYMKLIESDVLPTTSQASPAKFAEVFKKVVDDGDTAVAVILSSKLSGTCQSAIIAAQEFEDKIFVVDSENAALGAGILVQYGLQKIEEGMSAKEVAEVLDKKKKDIRLVALLDTLEYLKKGGRISGAAAFVGGILSIKPVIAIVDGEVKVLGKARGSKQGNNLVVEEIHKAGGVDFNMPLLLGYSGLSDIMLKKYVEDNKALWENGVESLEQVSISTVIGTHVGPGAIAVTFFKKEEN